MKKAASPSPVSPSPSLQVSESSDLPPISAQMQAFLDKSFNPNPGRWFYHLERFAADIEAQLVTRGLVERGEFESKGRKLIRYRGTPAAGTPESLDMP